MGELMGIRMVKGGGYFGKLPDPLPTDDAVPRQDEHTGVRLWNPRWGERRDSPYNQEFLNTVTRQLVIKGKAVRAQHVCQVASMLTSESTQNPPENIDPENIDHSLVYPWVDQYYTSLCDTYKAQVDPTAAAKRGAHQDKTRELNRRKTVSMLLLLRDRTPTHHLARKSACDVKAFARWKRSTAKK